MNLNSIPTEGNWNVIASKLNGNFDKVDVELTKIKGATIANKGYFKTLEELQSAYPSPSMGSKAYVGVTYPFNIYMWNGSEWENSGETGGEESVNLGDYYTKEETNEKLAETDAKLSELGSYVSNLEYVRAYTDADGLFLWGIKQDGSIEWAKGVPTPVKKYIESLDLENDEEIERINQLIVGLRSDVKELTDTQYYISDSEWVFAVLDNNKRILAGIRWNGECYIPKGLSEEANSRITSLEQTTYTLLNPEWIKTVIDGDRKIIAGFKNDGRLFLPKQYLFENYEDKEGRVELTVDTENRIVAYRDRSGKRHENEVSVKKEFSLGEEAMSKFKEELYRSGFSADTPNDWSDVMSLSLPEPSCAMLNVIATKMPTTSSEVIEGYVEYNDKQGNYWKKSCEISIQGQSSRAFAYAGNRCNYSLDITDGSEIKFGKWLYMDSWHLKGLPKDATRCALPVSYKFAYMICEELDAKPNRILSKSDKITVNNATGDEFSDFYDEARCLPDGFPFELYLNGDYIGNYVWQLKKHRSNYSMKKNDYTSILLDQKGANEFWLGNIVWSTNEIRNPKTIIDMNGEEYDGDSPTEPIDETSEMYDASNEDHVNTAQMKSLILQMPDKYAEVKALIDSGNIEEAKIKFVEYFDKKACEWCYLVNCLIRNNDSLGSNTLWGLWKNKVIAPALYDTDSAFGNASWIGQHTAESPSASMFNGQYAKSNTPFGLYWSLFKDELIADYKKMRDNGLISVQTLGELFKSWQERVGYDSVKRDLEKWDDCPSYRKNYTNTEYWAETSALYVTGEETWNSETEYKEGDNVRISMGYGNYAMSYVCIKKCTNVYPVTKKYDRFPTVGGWYESPKRIIKWFETQLSLCDAELGYNNSII